jgi:superfamily I DNA/RNA helicase
VNELIQAAAQNVGRQKFTPSFLRTEWDQVVDAWQLGTWEAYRDVQRRGRRTRLPETMRAVLWKMFEQVREELKARGLMTESSVFQALAEAQTQRSAPAYDAAVVDEAQDVSIAQLRFLAALGGGRPNALFFTGDLGQRIFQQPFSWKALGVDVRGRSKTLRVNYRTSHQIRRQADRLLGVRNSWRISSSAHKIPDTLRLVVGRGVSRLPFVVPSFFGVSRDFFAVSRFFGVARRGRRSFQEVSRRFWISERVTAPIPAFCDFFLL